MPMLPVDLALKLLLAQCCPMGVGATLVAGGPPFLADKRSRDCNKRGVFFLTTAGRWNQSERRECRWV